MVFSLIYCFFSEFLFFHEHKKKIKFWIKKIINYKDQKQICQTEGEKMLKGGFKKSFFASFFGP